MWSWLLIPFAYTLGSISSAILVCRFFNLPDPRQQGSKNPGATNVLRIGGKKAATITLIGDLLKGLLPVLLAQSLGVNDTILAATGLAAFFGHLYPVFFSFKGGKGVATAIGVWIGFFWQLGAIIAITWLIMAKIVRISSLSALVASTLAPFYTWWLMESTILTSASTIISIILLWRHRGNIQRLITGEETKIRS